MTEQAIRRRSRPERRQTDLRVPEGTMMVQSTAYNAERTETRAIRVPVFHSEPARVRVHGGLTINLGNYESARVDVSVDLPCYPNEADIFSAKEEAGRLVSEMIEQERERRGV